jgi:hypothetical protein
VSDSRDGLINPADVIGYSQKFLKSSADRIFSSKGQGEGLVSALYSSESSLIVARHGGP